MTHTRTSTDCGPDFCEECSRAAQEWVRWPCVPGQVEPRSFIADVLHDCLSSFQGLDHGEGVCCFDRDGAVEYLLSPASGLRIEVDE